MKFNISGNFMKGFLKKTGEVITKKSPVIAATLGVIGLGCAVFSAVKATPKAMKAIEKAEIEKNSAEIKESQEEGREVNLEPLTKKEKAVIYAKCYWKTAALTAVTTACIIGSVVLANRQTKAMALLYATTATTLEQYKDAAKEVVGEKTERKIDDRRAQRKVEGIDDNDDCIINTGRGMHLCYDCVSNTLFYSDIEDVRKTINELNAMLMEVEKVSINDYLYALGLDEIEYGYANDIGWKFNKEFGNQNSLLELRPASGLTKSGKPYYAVKLNISPSSLYYDDVPWR